ncbi:hypothetical protein [Winogradskyella pulchriflava]|uniref:Uncharacterized protein n=1 Tax=Winogradskyella pulchriflava TaxID=1110688 RepID=A0ABV6QAT5_9FLAO
MKNSDLEEKHKFTEPIINSMKTLLKGEITFSKSYNKWIVKAFVKWNKKHIRINLNSRKTDLKTDFSSCSLTKSKFLTFLSRSDTYNFSGKKSKYSELLLESIETQYLMDSRNPRIKLEGKSLIFEGEIRKKNFSSLSNIFKLFEMLMDEIEWKQKENAIQQHE